MKKLVTSIVISVFTSVQAQTLVMETGSVLVDHSTVSVTLNNTFDDPVVIATPPTLAGGQEAVVRISNVTETGFNLRLEESINRDNWHLVEKVQYMVVEKGTYDFGDGIFIEAGTVDVSDLDFQTVSLSNPYVSTPAIFTQIQTKNTSTVYLKTRQKNATSSDFEVKVEREEVLNSTSFGGTEQIGYVAFAKGSGFLDDILYEVGSFTASSTVTTFDLSQSFSEDNLFMGSIASFNGSDPADLRTESYDHTAISVKVHEDVSEDAEQSHTNETIDYFVINTNNGEGIYLPILLPIELKAFNAKLTTEETVELAWITASEINNDFFTLERSTDGKEWEQIGTVKGAGNSSAELRYTYTDRRPLPTMTYYRLKQTDFDGAFSHSTIRTIVPEAKAKAEILIYPVPSNDYITVEGTADELEELRLFNAMGQEVIGFGLLNDNTTQKRIDLSELPAGIYFVKTKSASQKIYKI